MTSQLSALRSSPVTLWKVLTFTHKTWIVQTPCSLCVMAMVFCSKLMRLSICWNSQLVSSLSSACLQKRANDSRGHCLSGFLTGYLEGGGSMMDLCKCSTTSKLRCGYHLSRKRLIEIHQVRVTGWMCADGE